MRVRLRRGIEKDDDRVEGGEGGEGLESVGSLESLESLEQRATDPWACVEVPCFRA